VVEVRLGPGGVVLAAQVVRSSGNAAFDRSAETAVRRADPLPMPDDPVLAAPYREGVELVFAPDE
jgi:colicin import membrane protein